jgi:hypothetical protein
MRRSAAVLLVAGLVASCGQRGEPEAQPQEPPAESGPGDQGDPASIAGATCRATNEGNPANFPDFTSVDLVSAEGVDRITFEFEPQANAPDAAPWHYVSFTDRLITEGEGKPVEVEGEAFLVVSFQAVGHDLSGETPVAVYKGPERFTPGFDTLQEAVMLGDFEGQVSWGLGLSRKACYRLDAGADHLTVELPAG